MTHWGKEGRIISRWGSNGWTLPFSDRGPGRCLCVVRPQEWRPNVAPNWGNRV